MQIAYAIGVAEPVSLMVKTFDTNRTTYTDSEIAQIIDKIFDLRPAAIIEKLGLKSPIYLPTAAYWHFGREPHEKNGNLHFAWEKLDMVDKLRETFEL